MSEQSPERALSAHDECTLAAALDQIIPPSGDGRLPGAGALALNHAVRIIEQKPELRSIIARGLRIVDDLARSHGARAFVDLDAASKPGVLRDASVRDASFFGELLMLAARAYYQDPRVLEALGLEPRPPYPDGYHVEPTDFALLDGVRRRAKMYRDIPS